MFFLMLLREKFTVGLVSLSEGGVLRLPKETLLSG